MKVNFIICGTQKGGTTALDVYLRGHPEICMAREKEVHFFDNEEAFASGRPDYDRYHAAFDPQPSHKLVGEATPIYMYWRPAPRRMREYSPELKLIVVLRNPIERAYSHWNMEHGRDADDLPFWEAIQGEQERCRAALPLQHRVFSYVDRGFYLQQLRRLWEHFPREQVLVLRSDELRRNPQATISDVCEFLGLSPLPAVEPKDVHAWPYAAKMSDRERDYLRLVFADEIGALERELGWDCGEWLAG